MKFIGFSCLRPWERTWRKRSAHVGQGPPEPQEAQSASAVGLSASPSVLSEATRSTVADVVVPKGPCTQYLGTGVLGNGNYNTGFPMIIRYLGFG